MRKPQEKRRFPSALLVTSLTLLALITLSIVPPARAAPYVITIVSVETTDQAGNPRNVFWRGELVMIKVKLSCPGGGYSPVSYPYIQFVRTTDPDLRMVYLGFMSSTISSGENQSSTSGFTVPLTATTGQYKVKVMLSNTRPSNPQFQVLAAAGQATFTVT